MEARRYLPFSAKPSDRLTRVVEPELDMNRARPEDSSWARYVRDVIYRLFPVSVVASKARRSIGRELEEHWPSIER